MDLTVDDVLEMMTLGYHGDGSLEVARQLGLTSWATDAEIAEMAEGLIPSLRLLGVPASCGDADVVKLTFDAIAYIRGILVERR